MLLSPKAISRVKLGWIGPNALFAVSQLFAELAGVSQARVNLDQRLVTVTFDDTKTSVQALTQATRNAGYLVVTAQNAHEALKKINEEAHDAVFTDIKMPGMDGIELAERVKARRPWTPVVIVTGYGSTANEERANAAGVSAFLRKPLSPVMIEGSAPTALHQVVPAMAAPQEASPTATVAMAPVEKPNHLKNIALFIAAPFVGLVYAAIAVDRAMTRYRLTLSLRLFWSM